MVKNRFKKIIKRSSGLVLAAVICMSAFSGLAVASELPAETVSEVVTAETESESTVMETIESSSEAETEDAATAEETVGAATEETVESTEPETEGTEVTGETETATETVSAETEETEAAEETEASKETETEAASEATEPETSEAAAETTGPETTTPEPSETAEAETGLEDIYACSLDISAADDVDLSSMRLIVATGDESIFADPSAVISSYGGVYLLQFEDMETARAAYVYYLEKADLVEPDLPISACEGEASADGTGTSMTENENPFVELEEAISQGGGSYDIALIDTGASGSNVAGAVSMLGDFAGDDNGHGTEMAGFIAETAPEVSILSIKALGSNGTGDTSAVYAAVQYAISQGVKVINLSMSAFATSGNSIIAEAIREAAASGIIVVGAAGNNGSNAAYFVPGNVAEAVIAGSCDAEGRRLAASNYGGSVDYNVVSESTSEAAARLSGWIAGSGMDSISEVLDHSLVFSTDYDPDVSPASVISFDELEAGDKVVFVLENKENGGFEDAGEFRAAIKVGETVYVQNYSDTGIMYTHPATGTGNYYYYESYYVTTESGIGTLYCMDSTNTSIAGYKEVINGTDKLSQSTINTIAKAKYLVDKMSLSADEKQAVFQTYLWVNDFLGLEVSWGQSISSNNSNVNNGYSTLVSQMGTDTTSVTGTMYLYWSDSGQVMMYITYSTQDYGSLKVEKSISTPVGSLRISKTTTGADSDKNVEFTFTLKVTNSSGTVQSKNYSYTKSDGTSGSISGNNGTVKLKSGQNVVITGIPQGYGYTVNETAVSGYTTKVSKNGAAAVTGYQASGTIPAASNSQAFTFTVNIKNGSANVSGLKTDSSGNVSFTLTPGTSGSASKTLSNIPAGYKYTVTETAVTGWTTDPSNRTRTGSITANDTKTASFTNTYTPARETADFTNTRNTSPVKIVKTSSASAAVKAELKDNKMYSQDFSGAQFSVRVKDKNTGAWGTAKTYTTGTDGSVTVSGLYVGDSVEITETKAPKGYLIPADKTKTITVAANSNTVTFADEPTFDPGTPVINKVRYTPKGELQKAEAVASAVFKMEYFDTDNCSGSAVRTWYFKTDADGTFNYTKKYLADGYTSSALFVNSNDDPDIPLGSVKFTEVASPKGYVVYEGSVSGKIIQGSDGKAVFSWITAGNGQILVASDGTVTIGDPELTVVIDKVDSGTGRPVKGAKLEILEGSKSIISWTTDGKPKVIRNLLEGGKTYTLRETEAPDSYKKAADIIFKTDAKGNITVVTGDIDTYTTSDGYLAIKMEDVKKVMLPVTGSNDRLWMILIGSLLLAGGFGTAAVLSLRKNGKAKAVIRKAAAGMAAVIAAVTVAVPTFAAGNIQVVRNELPPHSYTAYQLLSGTKLEDDILWDIKISEDIPDSLWDELGVDAHTRGATDIAHWLSDSVKADTDGSFAVKTARAVLAEGSIKADAAFGSGDTISLEDGYYLVTSDDAQPMLVLIGNGETLKINEKSSVPTSEKEIGEVSIDDVVVYGDAADTGLGKIVPYRITGTLPSNYNAYDRYTYNFRDRYDSCLIVDEDSIKVTVVNAAGEVKGDITKYAEITVGKTDMKVGFDNLKEAYAVYEEGDILVVDYEVMIDENASIGAVSNDNYAWIEYTRSPTCEKLGESEPDECRLYTWEMDLNKIAEGTGHALAGAEFTIQDGARRYVNTDGTLTDEQTDASVWTTDGDGHFEVKEVDSGSYTVTEIKAPAGYQKAGAFELTVEVSYQDENNVQLTATASGSYAEVTAVDAKCGIAFVQVSDVPAPPRGNPPSTGDASNIALYGGIMLAAIAALTGLLIILKRSRAKSED